MLLISLQIQLFSTQIIEKSAIANNFTYLFVFGKELFTLTLLGCFLLLEESVINLGSINSSQVDLGAGAEGVDLVHSSEGHSVDLEGACHEQQS